MRGLGWPVGLERTKLLKLVQGGFKFCGVGVDKKFQLV